MTAPPRPAPPWRGPTSLLEELARGAEDPSYADAAGARRRPGGAPLPPPSTGRRATGVVLVVLVGVLTGTAGAAVRAAADDGAQAREQLVDDVEQRAADSDALAADVARLRAEVADRRDAALASDLAGRDGSQRLTGLELAAGTVPVTGPGVVVTLDDRPPPVEGEQVEQLEARGGLPGDGRVLDRDLQQLVNGLWAAGAEAVTVNDQRLTARTAIRSAGEAVLVDFRPLSPPYVVRAVGEPGRLEPAFVDSAPGRALATSAELYGLRLEVRTEGELRLPAGAPADLRSATAEDP